MSSSVTNPKLSIVYFGSGPLAAESLTYLHQQFDIEAVVTKPRPAHHHGAVPVLDFCQAHQLTCLTPATKAELSAIMAEQSFSSQLGVVIDYGIIINQDVIDTFPLGIVNSHFSLLPEWRGADPITFALLSGQTETGVSLMLINDKMDEGSLLAQAPVTIDSVADARSLTADLTEISNGLLSEVLPLYASGALQPVPQTSTIGAEKTPTYSRKLTKQDGNIDWQKPAVQIEREIRAFIEWPKSRCQFDGREVVITKARVQEDITGVPGTIQWVEKQLVVTTGSGGLIIERLKPAGKADMTAAAFMAGYGQRIGIDKKTGIE